MSNAEGPPEISPGALYLLRTARNNDSEQALTNNAALFAVLEFGEKLMRVCREQNLPGLFALAKTKTPPQTFLVLTAAILHRVQEILGEPSHATEDEPEVPVFTDFNDYVLQGFAQALADLAWPERSARDFDGPLPETFLARISRHDVNALWTYTLQHYIANIFQAYFAALRFRERNPDLDPLTEIELRSWDARDLAEYAMRLAAASSGDKADPKIVLSSLDKAINEMLKGEGEE
ncbi:MAG: hypothetical protein QOH25_2476 [Acidobacteriota bacterium]|jgi:hypothetical protein|nr:hypothetical protein [Acidobacteriota bacterium]